MKDEPLYVLLVDDTPENLVALDALLRRDGVELLKARSGAEALELLLQHEVSLALLDVQMPEMDGFELAELMRGAERSKHIPIIFITAGSRDPQRMFKGYESGAVDFLFKPVDPLILRSKVDVFLDLAAHRRELANALRLSEYFIGILGHDLRNPLGAVVAGTELLTMHVTDPHAQSILRRIAAATGRMTEMIEALLDLTRARLGRGFDFVRSREPIDLGALLNKTIDELRAANPNREIVCHAVPCTVIGDPARLTQVFSNLVGNAIVHGRPATPITVRVVQCKGNALIAVHNEGVIPEELRPTLFEPFGEQDETRRGKRSGGLGLGLFIAQQIARAHGGEITVDSSEERGTTLTVSLPDLSPSGQRRDPTTAPAHGRPS
jgi:signal transduction histidine kinase